MSSNKTEKKTAIGLDVGTSRIVTARTAEQGFACESQLNAFVSIPHSRMTEGTLKREGIPYNVDGSTITVPGNESARFADLLQSEVRRPMTGGLLNPHEPDNVRIIGQITGMLLGETAKGQKVCFTVPAAPISSEHDLTYHEATLRQVLCEMGVDVTSINEGLAVIYSELAETNYTGIGVSCGGGLCNICFAYLSVPVVTFSIPKAGDFIDSNAAAASGERANRIRILKEQSFYLNGSGGEKVQQALGVYYEEMIRAVVNGMREAFAAHRRTPKITRPVPLVLSGGSAMPRGFRERFEKILAEGNCPIPVSEVRLAADPLTVTARGALAAALSEM
ncbi:MAG: hypothetical protein U0Q18_03360 [Bryobacteraceae bacterium]